jgi:hypothetical protein
MDGGLDDPLVRMHRWDALRQRLANSAAGRMGPVVDEVVEAIATVLHRHGPLTVSVTVEGAEAQVTAQLSWRDGQLVVTRSEPHAVPGAAALRAGETSEETAARLAELIRRDPSLLEGRENWGAPPSGRSGVSD